MISKYFNTFETQADFDAAEIGCPSVSLVKEDNVIYYCENTVERSTMEYLDVSGMDKSFFGFKMLLKIAYQTKIVGVGGTSIAIAPFGILALEGEDMGANLAIAIAIDFKASAVIGSQLTDYSVILSEVYTEEQLAAIPRITKEQFYNLEA